jgi:hypothetical protein
VPYPGGKRIKEQKRKQVGSQSKHSTSLDTFREYGPRPLTEALPADKSLSRPKQNRKARSKAEKPEAKQKNQSRRQA